MKNNRFVKLNNINTPKMRDGFSLDTLVLEKEMMTNNGRVDLSKANSEDIEGDEVYRLFVPHFLDGKGNSPNKEEILEIVNKYPAITSPCSMLLGSIEELSEHMGAGYQVAHFNYILGKKHRLNYGCFPNDCCGMSSRSVMLSLIEFGYPNAAYAYSEKYDHGYVILPFVFEKENIRGTIVVDPTSDQLWNKNKNKRNAVFIKLGSKWEYKTDWEDGGNLFPDVLCSIDILRKESNNPYNFSKYHDGGKSYFKKAFSNPVLIKDK